MNYCKRCIMPNTRPDQYLNNEGVCNGCLSYDYQKKIDWDKRKKDLLRIISEKKLNKDKWNCVVPGSGGKDSTYQIIKAKELGLNPIFVTASTCDLSEIGRKNLENIKKIGFDVIEISNNAKVRSKINKIGLELLGDISWPEHVSIFTAPVKFALAYDIPLILWGENPQLEYGGPDGSLNNSILDQKWMEEFGGLIGFRVSDLIENHGFKKNELEIYDYPAQNILKKKSILGIFLGYYERWDSLRNYEVSKDNGFLAYEPELEGCYFNFEKIDNHQHGIHDYFKFLKFGFARATDQLCYMIRRNKITRENAINLVKKLEGKYPKSYMGKSLDQILSKIDMTEKEFIKICDNFTNKKIFKTDQGGKLIKDEYGSLVKLKYDN
ncbi:N-acetyl sugar amidotransferase [Pelagibacterales bacterium SAG-MED25]|uniref:N-acetyl sugar amidotransferase n=1 Tax=Pelagibacter sp. (strain HTCC7211) TaxID=439493 RepID=UPI000A00DDB6|nr:N-acetyl sugar amidotransferase [Candidatus Pelagibacter sp. HTCC7211]MBD1151142.1 N-acetyl sugar amidotransferase [Pelagibacterales bacterium SAG-MED25]